MEDVRGHLTHDPFFKVAYWRTLAQHGELKRYAASLKRAKPAQTPNCLFQYIFVASTQTRGVRSLRKTWLDGRANATLPCVSHQQHAFDLTISTLSSGERGERSRYVCIFMNGCICVSVAAGIGQRMWRIFTL